MRVGEPSAAAARLRADPLTEVRATWACDEVGVLPELGGSSSFCFLSELTVGPVRRCRAGRKDDDRDCSIVPRNCWQTSEPTGRHASGRIVPLQSGCAPAKAAQGILRFLKNAAKTAPKLNF